MFSLGAYGKRKSTSKILLQASDADLPEEEDYQKGALVTDFDLHLHVAIA
jgi:hypothetical protein